MFVPYGPVPDMDTEYECPQCGHRRVTYYHPECHIPRTLKCGECGCRFDWRTGEIVKYVPHKDTW